MLTVLGSTGKTSMEAHVGSDAEPEELRRFLEIGPDELAPYRVRPVTGCPATCARIGIRLDAVRRRCAAEDRSHDKRLA